MKPTSNTSVIRSEECATAVLGKARWASRQAVIHRPRTAIEITDEQAAMITKGLQELAMLAQQIEELWRRRVRLSDEILRCYAAMVVDLDGDSILSVQCGETRHLRQTPCSDTQVNNRPRWK